MALKSGTWYVLSILSLPAILAIVALIFLTKALHQIHQDKTKVYHPEQWQESLSKLNQRSEINAWQKENLPSAKLIPSAEEKGFDIISQSTKVSHSSIQFYFEPAKISNQENPQISRIVTQYTGKSTGLFNETEMIVEKK